VITLRKSLYTNTSRYAQEEINLNPRCRDTGDGFR